VEKLTLFNNLNNMLPDKKSGQSRLGLQTKSPFCWKGGILVCLERVYGLQWKIHINDKVIVMETVHCLYIIMYCNTKQYLHTSFFCIPIGMRPINEWSHLSGTSLVWERGIKKVPYCSSTTRNPIFSMRLVMYCNSFPQTVHSVGR